MDVLDNLYNYKYCKIFRYLIYFLFSWGFLFCYGVIEGTNVSNVNTIDINLLRKLQNSYYQLINFPEEKQENLERGRELVTQFADNSVNLAELTKVLDPEKTKYFIDNLIIRHEDNIAKYPGKDITDAIEVMLNKDNTLVKLNDEINQFNSDMKSSCLHRVINYAISQSAVDNESKKISNLIIKPRQQIIDHLQPKYKQLIENNEFNKNITEKLLDILPDISIIKLPLIRDIHKINPIVSPYNVVNKPYLEQYFEDDFGNILTSKKQINSAAEQLLPKVEVSSILNLDAACLLMNSIMAMHNFNNRHISKQNILDDYFLKKWINKSIDDFSVKKGYLKYNIKQGQDKVKLNAEMYAIEANKFLDDFLIDFYYAYITSSVVEYSDSKTNLHSICRLFCLKTCYKLSNFVISGNYCYGTTVNVGKRTDRKYFIHNHVNTSKIQTAGINLEYDITLDRFWLFIPSLFYKYSYYVNNKYTETSKYIASSFLDCIVNPNNYMSSAIGIGTILHGRFITSEVYIDPKFLFSIVYNNNHKNSYFDISLFQANIKREIPHNTSYKVNFGIEASMLGNNISCNIKYLLEIYSKYNVNLFCFEFCYNF